MRLFGQPKRTPWEVASGQIAVAFLDLRKEFSDRCLQALNWNISKGIIGAPRSLAALSGYAELSVMAFQMWTVRAASFGRRYLDAKNEELFSAI